MSAPSQGPVPGSYPYGQFPVSPYNGKPNRNQHPLPGSFNRQQFNPQSQTFIPGPRNPPFHMQSSLTPSSSQGINGYGNFQMSPANQMVRPSPPISFSQTFGSSQIISNSNPIAVKPANPTIAQTPQIASSQTGAANTGSSQPNTSSIPPQSSIAKWGTPSHLPPRPPPPAQPQPPKFNLPGSNIASIPRLSNNTDQFSSGQR